MPHDVVAHPRPRRRCWLPSILSAAVAALVITTAATCAEPPLKNSAVPDFRTWQFFSEKKLKPHLYAAAPGAFDSLLVSDDPACCQAVSPSGRWMACMVWNRSAIESELMILSREMDRWWPLRGYTAISYRWSPDGLFLVGYGKRRTASSVCFFAVDPKTRSAWFPDSISTPDDYDFAWDSTSRRVAICRPGTGSDPPRVVVCSLRDHKVTTLANVLDGNPTNPRWLADGTLLVTKDLAPSDSTAELRFPLPER